MRPTIVSRLGQLSTTEFMQRYWQRKPLLVRDALPGFSAPVSTAAILAQTRNDAAPSRLIQKKLSKKAINDQWIVTQGPLERIPSLKTKNWTVLLQGANTIWPELADIMNQFRFIGDARLDDLMVSVASDGGGVGPHLDSYDVFLLQATGQRHWRWGKAKDKQLQPDQPIKLLQNFSGGQSAVLGPGDMLYLPAGWAHDGVAQGECMTYSIGFRASTQREIVGEFLARAADDISQAGRQVKDSNHSVRKQPAKIPIDIASDYDNLIRSYQPSKSQIARFVGEHLSEPPEHVFFEQPSPLLSKAQWTKKCQRDGFKLHHASRALYDKQTLFINGDSFVGASRTLRRFFDQRDISPSQLAANTDNWLQNDIDLLYDLYSCGWILLK
jgi:50S ribosomal protein L16 3-hydroxylase